jgi:hypothetical protein
LDQALTLAVVAATFLGPVLAVLVSQWNDRRRDMRSRRMELFRLLMSTRKTPAAPERVKALNLVEIEFYGVRPVQAAFQEFMRHVNTSSPLPVGWHEENQKRLTKLLTEMARILGYKLQQLDVLDGGYYPQVHLDIESDQLNLRRALLDLCTGKRALWINQLPPHPASPFPPPPPPDANKGL